MFVSPATTVDRLYCLKFIIDGAVLNNDVVSRLGGEEKR